MVDQNGQDATRLNVGAAKPRPAPEAGTFAPGQLISNGTYRIVQLVARGGMGEIYLATHELQGTEHALKTMLPDLVRDERITQLFLREARALSQIRHDAVVRYEVVFRDEQGNPFIAMEYLRGPSLADLSRERSLSADEVVMLCRRLAAGLAAAHAQGIVHRDISPDNVILPDGSIEHAKLIDFGIAKDLAPHAGTLIGGDFAGKYAWASPEQLGLYDGTVDARSDIYSLGLILAAAASGRTLPMGETHVSVIKARQSVPSLDDVPPSIRPLLDWMLQPDPALRPESMQALLESERLREAGRPRNSATRAAEERPILRADVSDGEARSTKPRGRGWLILVAALLFLAAAGGAAFLFRYEPLVALLVPEPERPTADTSSPVTSPPLADPPAGPATSPAGGLATTVEPVAPATPDPGVEASPPEVAGSVADGAAPDVSAPIASAPVASPPIDPEAQLREALVGLDCAAVEIRSDRAGRYLHGFVGDSSDRLRLADHASAAGIRFDDLSVRPPPFCGLLLQLARVAPVAEGTDGLTRIDFNHPDGDYRSGDAFTIEINAGTETAGHLNVDFLDPEGTVLHLMPSQLYPDGKVAAGAAVRLGGRLPDGSPRLQIGAPYGQQMILAIWTEKPLFDEMRRLDEPLHVYLDALLPRLRAMAADGATPLLAVGFIHAGE